MVQASTSIVPLRERLAALPQADAERFQRTIDRAFAPLRRLIAKASRAFTRASRAALLARAAREVAAQRRTPTSSGRRPRATATCARRVSGDDPGDNDDDHAAHRLVLAEGHR